MEDGQDEAAKRRPAIPVRDVRKRNVVAQGDKISDILARRFASTGQEVVASSTQAGIPTPEWATLPSGNVFLRQWEDGLESESKEHDISRSKAFVVGRHCGENMIAVDHFSVSRKHALLVHRGHEVLVMDMSSNGTWINGNRFVKYSFV
jgi:hypothetical protein